MKYDNTWTFCSGDCAFQMIGTKLFYERFVAFKEKLLFHKKVTVLYHSNGNHILFEPSDYNVTMTWLKTKLKTPNFSFIPSFKPLFGNDRFEIAIEDLCYVYNELVGKLKYSTVIKRSNTQTPKQLFVELLQKNHKFAVLFKGEYTLIAIAFHQGSQSYIRIPTDDTTLLERFDFPKVKYKENYWRIPMHLAKELYERLFTMDDFQML
jgi:hypothetical protein